MGIIRREDIRGRRFENEIVCSECLTTDEKQGSWTEDEYILTPEIEGDDDLFFCDRCKEEL